MKTVGQVFREDLINQLKTGVETSNNVFILSYSNLSGSQINDIRKGLRRVGARVYVSRNTLAKIALKGFGYEKLADVISGQTAFVWSDKDVVEVAKILVKFEKDFPTSKVSGGLLEGKMLEVADVKTLAELPSKQVLLTMLLGTIQSPLTRLAGALNAKTRDLLSILKQLSEKKGGN